MMYKGKRENLVPLEKQQHTVRDETRMQKLRLGRALQEGAGWMEWGREKEEEEQLLQPRSYTAETNSPLLPIGSLQTCTPMHTRDSECLQGKDWVS